MKQKVCVWFELQNNKCCGVWHKTSSPDILISHTTNSSYNSDSSNPKFLWRCKIKHICQIKNYNNSIRYPKNAPHHFFNFAPPPLLGLPPVTHTLAEKKNTSIRVGKKRKMDIMKIFSISLTHWFCNVYILLAIDGYLYILWHWQDFMEIFTILLKHFT